MAAADNLVTAGRANQVNSTGVDTAFGVADTIGNAASKINPVLGAAVKGVTTVFKGLDTIWGSKSKNFGINQAPEIMIPLVGHKNELNYLKQIVEVVANEIIAKSGLEINYTIGTMIEVPRATIIADELAKNAEFFSFGTNDLTQMIFGFSRDDAGKFLKHYYERKILEYDPFVRIDEQGVGKLIQNTVNLGRSANKHLKCGICGEHGGDPASIEFANKIGVDYVSCSPYRVPIARLAAAQASIKQAK